MKGTRWVHSEPCFHSRRTLPTPSLALFAATCGHPSLWPRASREPSPVSRTRSRGEMKRRATAVRSGRPGVTSRRFTRGHRLVGPRTGTLLPAEASPRGARPEQLPVRAPRRRTAAVCDGHHLRDDRLGARKPRRHARGRPGTRIVWLDTRHACVWYTDVRGRPRVDEFRGGCRFLAIGHGWGFLEPPPHGLPRAALLALAALGFAMAFPGTTGKAMSGSRWMPLFVTAVSCPRRTRARVLACGWRRARRRHVTAQIPRCSSVSFVLGSPSWSADCVYIWSRC
jgi:hypothetical protein